MNTKKKMNLQSFFSLLFLLLLNPILVYSNRTNPSGFLQCLSLQLKNSNIISKVIHRPNDSSFSSILDSSIQNRRFSSPGTPKPVSILTPVKPSHVQSAVKCARWFGIHLRTRSGGHDYEGLSYVSQKPFIIIDLRNIRSINVDVNNRTVWVETGATIGELYHEIGIKTRNLAFPAGVCPTVGVGGHFSGGGYGTLLRKHGLAADHILDARVVDAQGRLIDRKEIDLFWAIRGGGGSSFGIVISWKIGLVEVPSTVTVFNVTKTSLKTALTAIHRWQFITDKISNDLFIRVMLQKSNKTTIRASFPGLYLGNMKNLLELMTSEFPELGLKKEDCREMSWIESVVWFAELGVNVESIDVLKKRTRSSLGFKAKSDFLHHTLPKKIVSDLWKRFEEPEAELGQLIFTPFGGKMSEISEDLIPFPHRKGIIYEIQYLNYWREEEEEEVDKYVKWVRGVYEMMSDYVEKNPRGAYVNLRDVDLGKYEMNKKNYEMMKYEEGKKWGVKYFKGNFERLVNVKTSFDPDDFFCDEQSIPTFGSSVEVM